jgi:fused signal recognition particle receptor
MNELTKVKRVMQKKLLQRLLMMYLVLDGSGQNAFEQAKQFTAATELLHVFTKLDVLPRWCCGISDQFKIPVNI